MKSGSTWGLGLTKVSATDTVGRMVIFAAFGMLVGGFVSTIVNGGRMPTWFSLLVFVNLWILLALDFLRRRRAIAGTRQALTGPMTAYRVPARVDRDTLTSFRWAKPCAVLIALPPDAPPRPVAVAMSPQTTSALSQRGSVHLLRLTPDPELAVLDTGVGPADLAAAAADPRWQGPLPSRRRPAGSTSQLLTGLLVMVVSAVAAVVVMA